MTPRRLVVRLVAVCALALTIGSPAFAQSLRKIGELQLSILGVSAVVEPAAPVIPRNTPAGVRVVVRSAAGDLSSSDVVRFFGSDVHVEADFTGPGLTHAIALTSAGENDKLLLKLPAAQALATTS